MNKNISLLIIALIALIALPSPSYADPQDEERIAKLPGHDIAVSFKLDLDAAARNTFQRYNNLQDPVGAIALVLESPILARDYPEVYAKVRTVLRELSKGAEPARFSIYQQEADAVRLYLTDGMSTSDYEKRISDLEALSQLEDRRFVELAISKVIAGDLLQPVAKVSLYQLIQWWRWHIRKWCERPLLGNCPPSHWY